MLQNRKVLLIVSILLFTTGFIWALTRNQQAKINDQQPKQPTIPQILKLDISNNYKDNYNTSPGRDQNSPTANKEKEVQKVNINKHEIYSPDKKYYKQAKALQKEFPNFFIMSCQTDKKRVAITFDDGPDSKTTPEILNILDQYDAPATFFVIGKNVKQHPAVLKRMIDEGHQVANHSWSHLRPTELIDQEFISEIISTDNTLQNYIKLSEPFFYRPPYGLLKPGQIKKIGEKGYIVISWSVDSLDWTTLNSKDIKDKVINSIHPGAIILMHSAGGKDGRLSTVKALPEIMDNLTRQGYEFVTIENLIDKK